MNKIQYRDRLPSRLVAGFAAATAVATMVGCANIDPERPATITGIRENHMFERGDGITSFEVYDDALIVRQCASDVDEPLAEPKDPSCIDMFVRLPSGTSTEDFTIGEVVILRPPQD